MLIAEHRGIKALDGQTDHTGLDGPLVKPIQHLFLAPFEQPDVDSRMPLGERPQLWSDERGGGGRQTRQAQRPCDITSQAGDFGAHQRQLPHGFPRMRQRNRTGFSQRERFSAAHEQRQPQLFFQRGDVAADGWLRQPEPPARSSALAEGPRRTTTTTTTRSTS